MGVRINDGSIVIAISDLTMPDASSEDEAARELTDAVNTAIEGACDGSWRDGLSLDSVNLDDVDELAKVASVRLTATVTVKVGYDPEQGTQPDDWASDYGWNFLAFEASDADFDYEVEDSDTGEDAENDADWQADDPVPNGMEEAGRRAMLYRRASQKDDATLRRVRDILASDTLPASDRQTWIAALFDVELAHGLANDQNNRPQPMRAV